MTDLLIFIILNLINVILQTFKAIITVNGTAKQSAVINAVTFGVYNVLLVYMVNDNINLLTRVIIVAIANYIGVYIVKIIVDKIDSKK